MKNKLFAIFILSHGRPHDIITLSALKKANCTAKTYIIIDNEDTTASEYIKLYGDRVIQFDKTEYAKSVDTPMLESGECDLSQVKTAIDEIDSKVIILRSTVPIGTTERLCEETGKNIIFAPEFYGTTQHCDHNTFDYSYTILGGDKKTSNKVVQLLQEVYDARHRFLLTNSKTAELTKYMDNTMLAAKVSLCVQFWDIANQFGINYSELRELFLQDCRFNRAHTFVYDEHPYWESHCFDKDLKALVNFANAPLIQNIIDYNEECKKVKK